MQVRIKRGSDLRFVRGLLGPIPHPVFLGKLWKPHIVYFLLTTFLLSIKLFNFCSLEGKRKDLYEKRNIARKHSFKLKRFIFLLEN